MLFLLLINSGLCTIQFMGAIEYSLCMYILYTAKLEIRLTRCYGSMLCWQMKAKHWLDVLSSQPSALACLSADSAALLLPSADPYACSIYRLETNILFSWPILCMAACGVRSDHYGQRWLGIEYLPSGQPMLSRKDRLCNGGHMYFTRFVLFFKDCDFSSGITNLRHTYGTITIRLKMNTFCFKQIDALLAKFLT